MSAVEYTGGCQCGAVRYHVKGKLTFPHICHCRMCQKASGNYFAPLARVLDKEFEVTRGEVSWFFSSDLVRRGFCSKCGTPLFFKSVSAAHLQIMLGSLDNPQSIAPTLQYGHEAKMPWFGDLDGLDGFATEEDPDQPKGRIEAIRNSNHQHPDHNTDDWSGADK